jgi:hypothetical protein
VPPEDVPDYLAAFDAASLSQSVDRVGSFRYTTKLSEYLAAELPIITTENPVAYDLDNGYFWRLPGAAPWSPVYGDALVELLEEITPEQIAERRAAIRSWGADPFDKVTQQQRMTEFIEDLLASRARNSH